MNTLSLVQRLDFTMADLIAPHNQCLYMRGDNTRYCISGRLYDALLAYAAEDHRLPSSVFMQLQEEVTDSHTYTNGPVGEALGFHPSDLMSEGNLCFSIANDATEYSISQRLLDAIGDAAQQRGVPRSAVFRELQAEITSAELAAA